MSVNDGPPWDSRTQALTSHQATEPAFLPTKTTFCQAFLARIFTSTRCLFPFRIPATKPIQKPNLWVFFLSDTKILTFDPTCPMSIYVKSCKAFYIGLQASSSSTEFPLVSLRNNHPSRESRILNTGIPLPRKTIFIKRHNSIQWLPIMTYLISNSNSIQVDIPITLVCCMRTLTATVFLLYVSQKRLSRTGGKYALIYLSYVFRRTKRKI